MHTQSADETIDFGDRIGRCLRGGEVIELVSDVGGGKTTLVRGIARGIGSDDAVMSPTFTISRIYTSPSLSIHHFDFYRLNDAGLMAAELSESIADPDVTVVIEWSDIVADVLPQNRLRVELRTDGREGREIVCESTGSTHAQLLEKIV